MTIRRRAISRRVLPALALGGLAGALLLAGPACTGTKTVPRRGGPAPVTASELSPGEVAVEFRALPSHGKVYSGALVARDGRVFLGVTRMGKPARLLAFDPKAETFATLATFTSNARHGGEDGKPLPEGLRPVLDDGPGGWVHAQDKIHARLLQAPDGRIYGATDSAVEKEHPDSTRAYAGGHFFACDPATGAVTDLGWPRRHEGIIALAMDPGRMRLYGLTWPCGLLVCCRVRWDKDGRPVTEGSMSVPGLTSSGLEGVPRYFDVLGDGRVAVCDGNNGDILVWLPEDFSGPIRPAGVAAPGKLARPAALVTPFDADPSPPENLRGSTRFRNWWRTGALSPEGLRIFTSGQRGGQLAEVDFTQSTLGRVVDHANAKPWQSRTSEGWSRDVLTIQGFAPDGRLFYTADRRLLSFLPERGEVRDHGTLAVAGSPEVRLTVEPGPAGFDGKGRMYFGALAHEPAGRGHSDEEEGEAEGEEEDAAPSGPEAGPHRRRGAGLAWVDLTTLGEGRLLYAEPR